MIDLIIAGDFVFPSDASSIIESSYESRFGDVKHVINNCDYSIVNLESPIINNSPSPINKFGPNLYAPSKSLGLIKFLGFKGVTLANNHFFDQGDKGVFDTIAECHKNSIEYFGAGINRKDAAQTRYIRVKDKRIAIINCCEIEFSIASDKHGGSNPLNPIAQFYDIMEAKKNADFVIIIVHGGIEHFQYPTLKMHETYRFFIDAGATAVINHHQHCFSGFEIYNEAPIVYGLGNFFFPRTLYSNTYWNIGYMVRLILDETIGLEVIPYNQCSGDFNIRILKGDQKREFDLQLDRLNSIIIDRKALEQTNYDYMTKDTHSYDWIFQPYDNKYLKILATKGLFPKLLSKRKRDEVMSLINCQSHFERFNFYLRIHSSKDL